ncbi:MAG TPA: gluconokinase [Pyrinomonadaceae bacterium]|nr:gluconokinase [Pyrinomonadaceae bacterium]
MNPESQSVDNSKIHSLTLALDIGTSSVRGALYDAKGNEIAGTQAGVKRTLCTTHDGGAELDAVEAVEQTARTIDAVLAHSLARDARIEAVAVSCFWHSLVGVDSEGRAATPVFGWADTRAARYAEGLKRGFDERQTHARTGCRFHSSYWPAKLLWLRAEQPEIYSSVRRWMSFGELLAFVFFNEATMSISMASGTGALNLRSCEWDAELLEAVGVAHEQLPSIAEAHAPLNKLTDRYARRWPQLKDARWFPAIADGAANNIGAGCTTRESAALMIGTSGAMRVLWEGLPPAEIPPSLWCYRADSKRVVTGGALSDGGGLYSWMNDALALSDDLKQTERELALMEPDAHGLTILPFWAGERSTGWTSDARGAILGFTMHTRPLEILRASMEAIAYRFALISRALDSFAPASSIIASGGALVASPTWSQMLADVLGRPVYLSNVAEASSRGAVLLALEAAGKLKSIADAPAPFVQIYEPDMARHTRYQLGLERQQDIYARLVADKEIAGTISEASRKAESADRLRCDISIQQSEETS